MRSSSRLAAVRFLVLDGGRPGHVGMALRRVGHDHLVAARRVLEEVIDAFLFHEPAGEGEVRLAVLHAVIARLEGALDLRADSRGRQHLS